MPLVGGRIDKLEAKRKKDELPQEMKLNVLIDDVQQDKKVLKVAYTATMHYAPEVAEITISGQLFWEEANEKNADFVMSEYKRTRNLPNDQAEEIVTAINYTMGAVGTLGAFALGVTAPINTPRARISPLPSPVSTGQPAGKAS